MAGTQESIKFSMTPEELEALIRRAVRTELNQMRRDSSQSILDDWSHEGPDDPEGDESLLAEAMAVLNRNGENPDAWMSLEAMEAELDRAEAAGELSA